MRVLPDKCVACGTNVVGDCVDGVCYVYCPKCLLKSSYDKYRFSANTFAKAVARWRKHENQRRHFYDKQRNGKKVLLQSDSSVD